MLIKAHLTLLIAVKFLLIFVICAYTSSRKIALKHRKICFHSISLFMSSHVNEKIYFFTFYVLGDWMKGYDIIEGSVAYF